MQSGYRHKVGQIRYKGFKRTRKTKKAASRKTSEDLRSYGIASLATARQPDTFSDTLIDPYKPYKNLI